MPFPLAHAAAGVGAILVLPRPARQRLAGRRGALFVLLLALVANLPDLDFLPGLLVGDPHRYHHGVSHSLLAALLLALAAFGLCRRAFDALPPGRLFLCLLVAASSHTLLDFFSVDTSPPHGVPLFWPLSSGWQTSPVPLFLDVIRSGESSSAFFRSLFSRHNLAALGVEALFAAAVGGVLLAGAGAPRSARRRLGVLVLVAGLGGFLLAGRLFWNGYGVAGAAGQETRILADDFPGRAAPPISTFQPGDGVRGGPAVPGGSLRRDHGGVETHAGQS